MIRLKTLLLISLRNVFRNKRRTLFTLSILALGSTGLILVGGYFDSLMDGLRETFIHSQTGHLKINVSGYYEKGSSAPHKYLMKDVKRIQETIEASPHVSYTVPRLQLTGIATSDKTSIPVLAIGTDPELDHRMGSLVTDNDYVSSVNISEGKDLDNRDPYGVVIGVGLMKALGLKVGDSLSFITTREEGALDGADFHIRGAFQTVMKDFDDRAMKMPLKTTQSLLGTPNQVHSLLVLLNATENTDLVKADLESLFRQKKMDLEVFTWLELGDFYRRSRDLLDKIFYIIQFIIYIIFFFSITNTINMSLYERMREFGTMMAIGNSRPTIFATIFGEAVAIGISGAVLGILFGCGSALIISAIGIEMPPPPQGTRPYIAVIMLSPELLGGIFVIAMLSTLLASILPGYRASHYNIVTALGYV